MHSRMFGFIMSGLVALAVLGFPVWQTVPAFAQAVVPKPPPPPWGPGGGTIDPKDPYLAHNPKDGPSDYVWDWKVCRWLYKNAGKDALGNHKAGELTTQGPPTGSKINAGTDDKATDATTGNTFTYDPDIPGPKGGLAVPGSGKGWVNDKTGVPLCAPPKPAAAVAPAPGGVKPPEREVPKKEETPPPKENKKEKE